jgi:hypothetical protein
MPFVRFHPKVCKSVVCRCNVLITLIISVCSVCVCVCVCVCVRERARARGGARVRAGVCEWFGWDWFGLGWVGFGLDWSLCSITACLVLYLNLHVCVLKVVGVRLHLCLTPWVVIMSVVYIC